MGEFDVTLPHGLNLKGEWTRAATLCPLTGRDEAFLLEHGGGLFPAQRTTALLSRCLARLGADDAPTPAHVQALTIGDREALLLHLRRLTQGEKIECLIRCPNAECGAKLDLDLYVRDLLLAPYSDARQVYQANITEDGATYHARFRLPNGADQEFTAPLARRDLDAAANVILQRCIESVTTNGEGRRLDAVPPAVSRELPRVMAELDPQAETILNLTCPVCESNFAQVFDAADFFYREITGRRSPLYREVHLLAYHYHWSEREIMAMTERKRRVYLDLLMEQVGGPAR